MRDLARRLLFWFAFWTAVSLFFASRAYFGREGMGGPAPSYFEALRGAAVQWYTWGVFSLVIIRIARSVARGRSLLRRLLLHLPLSVLVTSAYFVVVILVDSLLSGRLAAGKTGESMLSFDTIRDLLSGAFQWNYLIYWLVAGSWLAWDYHRESQARLLEAARFELRTTQLEQRLAEARLLNLSSQLQPHFLFNALNAISAFVEKDPRAARRMIGHLGDLLRFSLEHSERQETSLEEDLAALGHYLAIQRARFEDHLQLRMDVAPDAVRAAVPGLILQPLVENAILHAVARRTEPVCVTIRATRENADLQLQVVDDGPGLPVGWSLETSGGVGLANTKRRLEHLYPASHSFEVSNSECGGVTARIVIPFRTNGAESKEVLHDRDPCDHRG